MQDTRWALTQGFAVKTTTMKTSFWAGFRTGLPFLLVVGPFATLFGVVGTEAGLDIYQVMGFSVLVIAGAAQFTAIQLMQDHVPTLIVLASALAVNMRMVMYSASLTPHLGAAPVWKRALVSYFMVDQSYAAAHQYYEQNPELPLDSKLAFFFGVATAVAPFWYLFTYVGAAVGTSIPPEYALDFAVPITFLAIIAPGLRTIAHVAAAMVSIIVALLLNFLPYNLWLLVAAFAAMITGAQVELWMERQK